MICIHIRSWHFTSTFSCKYLDPLFSNRMFYRYARDCQFSPDQIGAFFSIVKFALDKCKDPNYPMIQTVTECRNILIHHSSNLGDAWDLFGVSESKQVIDFLFLS